MIKKIGDIIIAFFICHSAFAFEVEYNVNPSQPAKGVPFRLTFKIQTEGSTGQPIISFDKGSLEIISRDEPSVTLRTLFINGRLETSKSYEISYELVSDSAMPARITNIVIKLDDQSKRIHDIGINVLSKPKEPEDVFVELDIPKTDVYLGEGVNIDYYVYSRVQLLNQEIQQFPKLNGVIKRFRMPNQKAERVERDGRIYTRYLVYAARVYPEKVGKIEIDPIKLLIQYASGQSISPFGGFGFGIPRAKSRSFLSQKTYLNVKELPPFSQSGQFTGLIGNHNFNLTGVGSNYLENEPIELKLEVNGEGALEKMEPIKLISNELVEEFDTKINFEETSLSSARKIFEHTFLGRGEVGLPAQKISLYTFDPATERYVEHVLNLGSINIGSVGNKVNQSQKSNASSESKSEKAIEGVQQVVVKPSFNLVGPEFNSTVWKFYDLKVFATALILVLIIFFGAVWFGGAPNNLKRINKILDNMRRGKYSLADIHELTQFLAVASGCDPKSSAEEQLKVLNIDEECIKNIRELFISVETSNFNLYKRDDLPKMSVETYKILKKIIESYAKNIQVTNRATEPVST